MAAVFLQPLWVVGLDSGSGIIVLTRYQAPLGTVRYFIISSPSGPETCLSVPFLGKLTLVKTRSGAHSSRVAELGPEPCVFPCGPRASSRHCFGLKGQQCCHRTSPQCHRRERRRKQPWSVRSAPEWQLSEDHFPDDTWRFGEAQGPLAAAEPREARGHLSQARQVHCVH